jgi:hypothetical protein
MSILGLMHEVGSTPFLILHADAISAESNRHDRVHTVSISRPRGTKVVRIGLAR